MPRTYTSFIGMTFFVLIKYPQEVSFSKIGESFDESIITSENKPISLRASVLNSLASLSIHAFVMGGLIRAIIKYYLRDSRFSNEVELLINSKRRSFAS